MTEQSAIDIRVLAMKGQKLSALIADESTQAGSGLTDYHCSKSPLAADIKARTTKARQMATEVMDLFKQIEEEARK